MTPHGWDPVAEGCDCAHCPLGPNGFLRDPTHPWTPVRAETHPGATVLAVAENPAEEEVRVGRPLSGKSGIEWNTWLAAIGKKRPDVDLDNVIACMPPGAASGGYARLETAVRTENKRRKEAGLEPLPHPATCCAPRLRSVVARYLYVIPLGGTAAKAILGTDQNIQALRGSPRELATTDPATPRLVLPTLHPAFVLRATQWRDVVVSDIAKAFRWFEGRRNWTEPLYEWMPTAERLREWLALPSRFTVHDYETDSKDPLQAGVDCIGFARLIEPAETRACEKCRGTGKRLQAFHPDEGWIHVPPHEAGVGECACCAGRGERLVEVEALLVPIVSREDRSHHYYTAGEEEAIKDVIRAHMVDHARWKVGHNLEGYDIPVTERWLGVRTWPVIDTLPLARSRNPELPKGLGIMGSIFTDVHAWKQDADGKKLAYSAVSDRQLHYYCAPGDCAVNAKILDPLMAVAGDRGYLRPLRPELRPPSWPAHQPWTLQGVDAYRQEMARFQHRAGLWVDQTRREAHERKLGRDRLRYRALAQRYAHELGVTGPATINKKGVTTRVALFNPASDDQIASIIFDEWGHVPTKFTETGKPSVDDEVLREVLTSPDLAPDRFAFLDAVRRAKRAGKASATFVRPLARRDLWTPTYTRKGAVVGKPPLTWEDGRVRPFVSAIITSVSRLNSSEPNIHNIPLYLRDQFAAQPIYASNDARYPGRVLLSGDVDQFHLRIIANRWRVERLLQGFREGIDPHSALALDFFGRAFRDADGWDSGFSLKAKPRKGSLADKMRNMAKVIRYQGAYADVEEGLYRSVLKVEDKDTGDLPFAQMTLREVKRLYRIWMRAEPEWQNAWQWVMDSYEANGGWIEECVLGRRSGGLENGKKQAVVNYDILAAEPAIMSLVEADVRAAFPEDFEGPGTGLVVQVHDSVTIEMRGFAWEEARGDRKVVVCDAETEKRRLRLEECMNRKIALPGWEVPITATAGVAPVRRVDGSACLSNWKES